MLQSEFRGYMLTGWAVVWIAAAHLSNGENSYLVLLLRCCFN